MQNTFLHSKWFGGKSLAGYKFLAIASQILFVAIAFGFVILSSTTCRTISAATSYLQRRTISTRGISLSATLHGMPFS